jgi:hypothetical protein
MVWPREARTDWVNSKPLGGHIRITKKTVEFFLFSRSAAYPPSAMVRLESHQLDQRLEQSQNSRLVIDDHNL